MHEANADPRVPEPTQESSGISEGLRREHLNKGVLEKFAQSMTENIIQSLMSQMEMVEPEVDFGVTTFNQNQEMLAEGLASAVIEVALREVSGGQNVEGFQNSRSTGMKMDQSGRDLLDVDTEVDPGKQFWTSKDTQPCRLPLSQSGLPIMGSLDYPDAPPTTPLLPELERSRHSFARKLKGGLAKVFLPSPPPPTPKDKEDDSDSTEGDPRMELMEHLMHSLPTDDFIQECLEEELQHGAKMEAFAEFLSSDIINWVVSAGKGGHTAGDSDLYLLAHQLAETIIISSLDEAKVMI